ncbi:LLM class flavin-dependent oxidoreductase [Umezawaea tangerina]|uniref:Luciferase-like monooxygenase n=1 Tax=Umezawaea tangerina TaxID=84725 RepID=A0A2T0T4Z7_9PSEU|nr:LLM class flavin-dependent oxidoreductase [Umezawaea tangerina]PRY40746.1 luciferase-like monooxygenase [Umezawaea tangerina]
MTRNAFRSAVYLPPFGPFGDPAVLVDLAVRAEAAGWDGVFLWDHVVAGGLPVVDTWTTLGAMAQATSRVLLGPMVTPLARRRPWVVARQASTVSRLSGGRLVLGVGLGSDESGDFSRFGEPVAPAVRASMLDEGLDVLRAVWSGEAWRHDGPHHRVDLPASAPEPHPIPLWAASSTGGPAVLRRAGTCDGVFPNPEDRTMSPADVAALAAAVRPTGRPFDIAVTGNASHAWEEPKHVDLTGLADAGMTWWMESLIHFDPLALSLEVVDAGPPR